MELVVTCIKGAKDYDQQKTRQLCNNYRVLFKPEVNIFY